MTESLRVGSLCSGYGGLELGAELVLGPFEHVWHAEFDAAPSRVLAERWPGVPNLGDISAVTAADAWADHAPIDLLCAGFPCQDVSAAGKRAGLRPGTRTGLWFHIEAAIAAHLPRLVLLENVPGLTRGEWYDEPNDRCLCGWAYRRGGLHRNLRERRRLCRPSRRRNDGQGPHRHAGPGRHVRRQGAGKQAGITGLGGRRMLVPHRPIGGPLLAGDRPASSAQGGAGTDRAARSGDRGRARQVAFRAAFALDSGCTSAVRRTQDAHARAQSKGAYDPATGLRVTDCPACGRPVGHHPTRRVYRSGLGIVLRSLAALGYVCRWQCVRASDAGAAHRRERLFVVAWPEETPAPWLSGADVPGLADGLTLLPTPKASDVGTEGRRAGEGFRPPLSQVVFEQVSPTPRASDANGAGLHGDGGLDLRTSVTLLPTPRASDAEKGGPNQRGSSGDLALPAAVQPSHWGAYGPAIARWEHVIGRSAPEPTITTGQRRQLSPLFVEWLMGLPVGWVTDVLDKRTEALRVLGNGVVPQAAALALRQLLTEPARSDHVQLGLFDLAGGAR